MKNTVSGILVALFFSLLTFPVQAQKESKSLPVKKENIPMTFDDFVKLDLAVVRKLARPKKLAKWPKKLQKLSQKQVRFLDSLDYTTNAQNSVTVKIYTQDYAYQSRNSYTLTWNPNGKLNPGFALNANIDFEMKPNIEDFITFRRGLCQVNLTEKNMPGPGITKRLIFKKNFSKNSKYLEYSKEIYGLK